MAFRTILSSCHEDSISDMSKELLLHAVEVLNNLPFIEMILNLIFCRHTSSKHRVNQVLEYLPEEEKVVALGDYKVHSKEFIWCASFIKEPLQACLVLKCNRLVDMKHLEHQFFDIFDSNNLKGFVKKFDQISWCTR